MKIYSILCLSVGFLLNTVSSEVRAEDTLATMIKNDKVESILMQAKDNCNFYGSDVELSRVDIYQRTTRASRQTDCIKEFRGKLIASSPDADSRAKVKELMQPLVDNAMSDEKAAASNTDFMGLNWGVGFGFSKSRDEAIDDAEIVNGIVRVKSSKKEQPRVVLEFHKYFWLNDEYKIGDRGLGPFVAVATTQSNLLSGVGVGLIYGRKSNKTDSDGFSVGIGVILDGEVKDLASGFKADQAPPVGETVVRFENKARWSNILFVTRTF